MVDARIPRIYFTIWFLELSYVIFNYVHLNNMKKINSHIPDLCVWHFPLSNLHFKTAKDTKYTICDAGT
jgi:hypothetical protein